jgi:hypothetical protein
MPNVVIRPEKGMVLRFGLIKLGSVRLAAMYRKAPIRDGYYMYITTRPTLGQGLTDYYYR